MVLRALGAVQGPAGRSASATLDVPTTVAQTYTHYLPCGDPPRQRAARARAARPATTASATRSPPTSTRTSARATSRSTTRRPRKGLFVKNPQGQPYLLTNPFTADQMVSEIDFTHPGGRGALRPAARRRHRRRLRRLDGGLRRVHARPTRCSPTAAAAWRCTTATRCSTTAPPPRTPRKRGGDFAVFIRSGFHGVQPHARVVWGGDPNEDWSCTDGLCAALHQAREHGPVGRRLPGLGHRRLPLDHRLAHRPTS